MMYRIIVGNFLLVYLSKGYATLYRGFEVIGIVELRSRIVQFSKTDWWFSSFDFTDITTAITAMALCYDKCEDGK